MAPYLSSMQKDGVDLDDEGEGGVGHVRHGRDCDAVAQDHHEVVQQQLIRRPLLVVDEHVEEVVDEVTHGEGDEDVDGVVKAVDHVCAY